MNLSSRWIKWCKTFEMRIASPKRSMLRRNARFSADARQVSRDQPHLWRVISSGIAVNMISYSLALPWCQCFITGTSMRKNSRMQSDWEPRSSNKNSRKANQFLYSLKVAKRPKIWCQQVPWPSSKHPQVWQGSLGRSKRLLARNMPS